MSKQYSSPLMASIHETAKDLHAAGVMDKRTMREFDDLCLTAVRPLTLIRPGTTIGQPCDLVDPARRHHGTC